MSTGRQFWQEWRDPANLLILHTAIYTLAISITNGFIGAFLLQHGVPIADVVLLYCVFFIVRFVLRMLSMAFVRRFGCRRTIIAAVLVASLQYIPLAQGQSWFWLGSWLGCYALSDALYWPTYHAATAVAACQEKQGRQLGVRTALMSLATVLGPITGALLLTHLGGAADFMAGGLIMLLSAIPVLCVPEFAAGPVPTVFSQFRNMDRHGLLLFFADGWMASGWLSIWPIVYFVLLGSHYEAFGLANAAAGLVGALMSVINGRWIDRRRHDARHLAWVTAGLVSAMVLRIGASWWEPAGNAANLLGAAVLGAYLPLLMTSVYRRARQSPGVFHFHLALEGAWDAGAIAGHATGALVLLAVPGSISLAVSHSLLGVLAFVWLMRREARHGGQMPPGADQARIVPIPPL